MFATSFNADSWRLYGRDWVQRHPGPKLAVCTADVVAEVAAYGVEVRQGELFEALGDTPCLYSKPHLSGPARFRDKTGVLLLSVASVPQRAAYANRLVEVERKYGGLLSADRFSADWRELARFREEKLSSGELEVRLNFNHCLLNLFALDHEVFTDTCLSSLSTVL